MVDDFQRIYQLSDNTEEKETLKWSQNLAFHQLELELQDIGQKPWASLICHERALKVNEYYFSMNTTFIWRESIDDGAVLVSEINLPDALYTM